MSQDLEEAARGPRMRGGRAGGGAWKKAPESPSADQLRMVVENRLPSSGPAAQGEKVGLLPAEMGKGCQSWVPDTVGSRSPLVVPNC